MEIVLKNISYRRNLKGINMKISNGYITGLTGKDSDILSSIINADITDYKGKLVFEDYLSSVLISSNDDWFYTDIVKEEFKFIYKMLGINKNNVRQDAIEWFYKLSIDDSLYERKVSSLSHSEKYLIKMIILLSINTDIIIFENIFHGLDLKYRKVIKELLLKLKHDKIIIINDVDVNILYDLCDNVGIIKNSKLVFFGETDKIYQNVKNLCDLKLEIPYLADIVFKVKKKKGIKLIFRKDVRDVMKDIYRNV